MKNAKLLASVFCLMAFAMAGEAEAALLFDGSFKATEKWTGVHDALAVWTGYYTDMSRWKTTIPMPEIERGMYENNNTLSKMR